MAGWLDWAQQPWHWAALGWPVWLYALGRSLVAARSEMEVARRWHPSSQARHHRRSVNLTLVATGWALLLLSIPSLPAEVWLAAAPFLAGVAWVGGPLAFHAIRGWRQARRAKERLALTVRHAGQVATTLSSRGVPDSAARWQALAGDALAARDSDAVQRAWRCLDYARAWSEPAAWPDLAALELPMVTSAETADPSTLAGLEARARGVLLALESRALASSERAALTIRAYADLRELEPALGPVTARWLWWRATGQGQDREQWLRAEERLLEREPNALAPDLAVAESLLGPLRPRPGVPCAAPRLRGSVLALEPLADGTWCRSAAAGLAACDQTTTILLDAGAMPQAASWLAQDQPGSCAALLRWLEQQTLPGGVQALTREVVANDLKRPAPVLAALAAGAGRYRLQVAQPLLELLTEGLRSRPTFDPLTVRLGLALGWSRLDPGRSVALLKPLLELDSAGQSRHTVIELLARLRHPEVDRLLAQQVEAGRARADLPVWRLAALAAMARRGEVSAQAELDDLAPLPDDDPRAHAARLGQLAATGAARGLALADDYVRGRHNAGPPRTWASDIRDGCRLRMLEQRVAGLVYRAYAEQAVAVARGPWPQTPNSWIEEFRDALPLTA